MRRVSPGPQRPLRPGGESADAAGGPGLLPPRHLRHPPGRGAGLLAPGANSPGRAVPGRRRKPVPGAGGLPPPGGRAQAQGPLRHHPAARGGDGGAAGADLPHRLREPLFVHVLRGTAGPGLHDPGLLPAQLLRLSGGADPALRVLRRRLPGAVRRLPGGRQRLPLLPAALRRGGGHADGLSAVAPGPQRGGRAGRRDHYRAGGVSPSLIIYYKQERLAVFRRPFLFSLGALRDVDIQLVVGNLHPRLGELSPQVLRQGELGGPEVPGLRPAVDGVVHAAVPEGREIHRRGRVGEKMFRGFHGPAAGGLHRLRGRVVGGAHLPDNPPPAQGRVVHHLGGRQLLVGQQGRQAVGGDELGVVQADLLHRAGDPAGLDEVPDGEGMGGQNHQAPGHVAQNVLRRQGHAQGPHGEERHQRGHVDPQAPGGEDHRQGVQQKFEPCLDIAPDALLQLGPAQKPAGHLQQYLRGDQADQQSHGGGQYILQGQLPGEALQGAVQVEHRLFPSLLLLLYKSGFISRWPGRG